ncbi:MAG: sulfotransferase [Steroidobacteraceae bacterium]
MSAPQLNAAFEERLRRAHAALRAGQATTAERALRALEAQFPGEANCLWLLGVALLDQGKVADSVALLERALAAAPDFTEARVDLARAYRRTGRAADARTEVRRVLEKTPHHHRAWLAYGDVLVELAQYDDARIAFDRARLTDPERAAIDEATAALVGEDRRKSEELFRAILKRDASHVGALCGLAALSLAADAPRDAERLMRHALTQSEHLPLIYRGLAPVLMELGRLTEAEAATRYLARIEPQSPQTWVATAGVMIRLMRQGEAVDAYERALTLLPQEVGLRMSIGHLQKTLGRRAESEASYKAVLAVDPGRAEAWWSLADLKNYSFGDGEISALQRLTVSDPRGPSNEAQLNYALGKAFEQRRRYGEAFAHYARGAQLRRREAPFDIGQFERRSARIRAFFNAELFAAHRGSGDPSRAPIFIVGLPRSGSTLVEQILASHSQVEATMELPNVLNVVYEFEDMAARRDGYPETIGTAGAGRLTGLGRRYLEQVAPLLQLGRPRFTDKLPNNFSHLGLIHLMLPHATVIDVRRHPLDACFSAFKQYFAQGQTFSYDLEDLGRYYRCYLGLMDHWGEVLPGKVLQVRYEELVRAPEAGIRRLLAHCGLDFEPECLAFHETRRAVRTASAEQVRQPIYTSAVGHWRHFGEQLEPLRRALGECMERFE